MKLKYVMRGYWEEVKLYFRVLFAVFMTPWKGEVTPVGRLFATKISKDGTREDLGLVSTKVVTDAGVAFIVDAFQNAEEVETLKYHEAGTSGTAENVTDTALGVAVESRATGTTTEGASANIYRTVGTVAFTATRAIVEHGVFSAAAAGTLLDRSVFSTINVINGDAIEFTYELTFPAGS